MVSRTEGPTEASMAPLVKILERTVAAAYLGGKQSVKQINQPISEKKTTIKQNNQTNQ